MLVKVLSDNVNEQLSRSRDQLRSASTNRAGWQEEHIRSRGELNAARRSKPLWRQVLSVPSASEKLAAARADFSAREVARASRDVQDADRQVRQHGAGAHGEDLFALNLSALRDEWVMLRGYCNRRGETDCVLVGPTGVWAVEVKRRRVLLHAVGDRWFLQKLSARGNSFELEPAADRTGRSWPQQVGEIAQDLETWLRKQGHDVPVRTAVMVVHEQARVVECVGPGVDFVGTNPRQFMEYMTCGIDVPLLAADRCAAIVDLVVRDHKFHAGRRRSNKNRPRPR
ncbi:nuclease-related domain-containing protein [Nocardia salmonicida]|uniref:nuclease-related domain-containing protein n=1 Tax=Nocardia salmonicida TaxID=53431 RepID=UPI00371F7B40